MVTTTVTLRVTTNAATEVTSAVVFAAVRRRVVAGVFGDGTGGVTLDHFEVASNKATDGGDSITTVRHLQQQQQQQQHKQQQQKRSTAEALLSLSLSFPDALYVLILTLRL
jgi:hypothetical protein